MSNTTDLGGRERTWSQACVTLPTKSPASVPPHHMCGPRSWDLAGSSVQPWLCRASTVSSVPWRGERGIHWTALCLQSLTMNTSRRSHRLAHLPSTVNSLLSDKPVLIPPPLMNEHTGVGMCSWRKGTEITLRCHVLGHQPPGVLDRVSHWPEAHWVSPRDLSISTYSTAGLTSTVTMPLPWWASGSNGHTCVESAPLTDYLPSSQTVFYRRLLSHFSISSIKINETFLQRAGHLVATASFPTKKAVMGCMWAQPLSLV